MANAASTIEIELEIRDAINRLGKLEGELKKSSSAMDRVANSTKKMESAFRSAKNAASALVAAISVQQIAQAADTFTNFANQIRIATNSAAEAAAVQKELYRVSQTTGTAIEDTTKLYSRLRVAADQLGSSQAETIRITEIVAKSLAAAGTSSTEASGALLQLAQALNSPKVQAEEFNSLIDGMPNLLKEVEKQLGLTAGSLKKFVTDGNLTNQLFKDAILGSADAINEQFGAAQDTIATSLTRISNSFTVLIGKVEESTGIFSGTAKVMTDLAGEFDKSDGIVRDFAEGIKILGIAFDKLKQFAINLTKPLRDAFNMFTGGESNPIVTTINYIQAGFGFLSVAAQYEVQNSALQIERLTLHVRDFFVGMVANMFAFFEKVDNFFINQINKIIGYYNSAANAIGMDGDVSPIATSTEAQESALRFERDSAFELADNYRRSADLATQYQSALQGVAAEFRGLQQQIDSGTFIKTEEQLADVDLEATNAASSVEKLKEKIEELEKIEYTDFTGQISEAQQEEFTRQLEEQFRIRTELGQLTEDQQNRFTQALEEEFERVTEINALTQQKNDLYEASLFPKARELTYLEEATEQLRTQLLLQGQLSEEAERTAGAIISGVSGAGPNASRAANIAQSKSIEEAAAKLILSNEKVAAAIEEYFTLLFDTIDPLLDILGDLISAINRLIGALAEGVGNAIENFADSIGLGPNSYYGGGGFTRDIEALGGAAGGGSRPTNAEQAVLAAISSLDSLTSDRSAVVQNLIATAEASGNIQATIIAFRDSVDALINQIGVNYAATYGDSPDFMESFANAAQMLDNMIQRGSYGSYQDFVENYNPIMTGPEGSETLREDSAILLAVANAQIAIEELVGGIAGSSTDISEGFEAVSDKIFETAEEQIRSIQFQQLSAEEQIETLHEQAMAALESQKALLSLIGSEERRAELLGQIEAAEEKQLELYNLQISELQKLNEEREREANLLTLQNIEFGLQALLRDFERTIEKINDLVQGLFDQVNDLLFSDFNLAGPQETFALAQDTYESLLENAFDPDATEEDIKALQAFVNEYLNSARNVFKSSTTYAEIFEAVLGDLTALGLQFGFNAPIGAVEDLTLSLEDLLGDLPEELQTAVSDMIEGLNSATLAFAQQQIKFLTEVLEIPLTITNDNIVIDTSGLSGTVELTSENFSLDSTSLDLSLAMSTSMFTVDTSKLNFGTITPLASAGTPHLGTITPTVSFDISSVTDSFDSLSSAINTAIDGLLGEATAITNFYQLALSGSEFSAERIEYKTNRGTYGNQSRGEVYGYSSRKSFADIVATYKAAGLPGTPSYLVQYQMRNGEYRAQLYDDIDFAKQIYNQISNDPYFSNVEKYGFRRGGLVDPLDTIPAMLSPGEFILSPETVRRYGVSNLNRLNAGDSAAINATSDPEVKRLLAELIVAVRENDTEVNVFTDMQGQTKAGIEEFRSELRERTRRQGDQYVPARYI